MPVSEWFHHIKVRYTSVESGEHSAHSSYPFIPQVLNKPAFTVYRTVIPKLVITAACPPIIKVSK